MLRRLLVLLVIAWLAGFGWFVWKEPGPAGDERTDGIVVLTGGAGRIGHAVAAVRRHYSNVLLVSGVDPSVTRGEFAAQYAVPQWMMECCLVLDYQSTDTRTNALQTARWAATNHLRSLRLVTSDWHMRRAVLELGKVAPPTLVIVQDGVRSHESWRSQFFEYNKWLVRRITLSIGGGGGFDGARRA